jgi:TonB family protein
MRILLLFSLLLISLKFTAYAQTISIDSLSSLYQSFCDSKMIGNQHYIIHFKENIEMRFLGEKEIKGVGNIQEVTKETWFSSKARTKFLRVKRMDDENPFGIETEPETFVDEGHADRHAKEPEPEVFVDDEAEFPGGYPAMMAWIQKNLVFPKTAIENGVQGKCILRFVVSDNGTIFSVQVTKGVPDCSDCDKAAIKAIKSMPNWKPAKLNGRSVSSYCSIPVNFEIGKQVMIGTQTWNANNLNVDRFRNGDIIPEAKTAEEWINASKNKQAAWCYYDNDPASTQKYGKLYNWYAVYDTRGLAPAGWHVPSKDDWIVLLKFICGNKAVSFNINQFFNDAWSYDVSDKLNMALKSKIGWLDNGNNTYGYNALPGVMRTGNYSVEFWSKGTILGPAGWMPKEESICWWTGNEVLSDIKEAFAFEIVQNGSLIGGGPFTTHKKDAGLPIRCVKD